MIYLATPPPPDRVELYRRLGLGVMQTPIMGNRDHGLIWAADTGCFTQPERFDITRYYEWLAERPRATCLFATAPDVLGDPVLTWERSAPVLPHLRCLGYRAALVAQDGITKVPWDAFDCLFVGGSTRWKLSEEAYQLVAEAKRRGKWAHMGRVNSEGRYRAAAGAGYDSADGTYVGWGPDENLPKVERWLTRAWAQPTLWDT